MVQNQNSPPYGEVYHDIHLHTDTSLLDGVGTVWEYAERCKKRGRKYLCVTDHGLMGAVPQQIEACSEYGLSPVIGVEAYLNDWNHLVPNFKNLSEDERIEVRENSHLLLLAQNAKGYSKLVTLTSEAYTNDAKETTKEGSSGFYYKPRLSWKRVAELCSDGDVICSSGCFSGSLQRALIGNNPDKINEVVNQYMEVFGPDRFYIEYMMIDFEGQDNNNPKLLNIAEAYGLPLVLTNDVHYPDQRDAELQKIQLLIQSGGGTINNPKGLEIDSDRLFMPDEEELFRRWETKYKKDIPEDRFRASIAETLRICQRCGDDLELDTSLKLPTIPNADDLLIEEAVKGLKRRGLYGKPNYRARLQEEIEMIIEKGFASYFLIEEKIVKQALMMGSDVGPGRGSACGSLVCYCMDITDVDPIKYNLLFWRFLNPARGGQYIHVDF